MTGPLPVAQAAAYVRELSADVRGVAVVAADGAVHAQPAALAPAAAALAALLGHGWVRVAEAGLALVARTPNGAAVVVAAGPLALAGPTALDAAAVAAALAPEPTGAPPEAIADPSPDLLAAARAVLAAA